MAAEQDLYQSHLDMFLDPNDHNVQVEARAAAITDVWVEAAKQSQQW